MKRCRNCNNNYDGMFEICYQCFDCETEFEYEQRREDTEIIRKNTEWMIKQNNPVNNTLYDSYLTDAEQSNVVDALTFEEWLKTR